MKVTETYLKNKKEIEKFLNTFSFDAESEARIRAYIDNPLSVVNDDIKRMFEKFDGDNEIVDYRIPLPASIMKQRKKYQKEIYLIMATVVSCLVEDDQFTFTVDANGSIIPNVSLSADTISENYFKIKNDKRKVWKYLDSKAASIAKRVYETWLDKKTFKLNDNNEPEFYIDLKSNNYGLYTFLTIMDEYVRSLGTKRTSLRDKIQKIVQNPLIVEVKNENHSEIINSIVSTAIKPFFNITQEIISAKMLDMNKYKLYLSFNVFDWLLASSGETWHSCIDMASSYAYGVGMLGMCGCPDWGMLLYTDGTTKTFGGIESYHLITRSWACYSDGNKFQLINWYPKDIRTTVDFSGCEDIKFALPGGNFERRSKSEWEPIVFENGSLAWIYADINEFTPVEGSAKVYFKFNGHSGLPRYFKFNNKIHYDREGYYDSVVRAISGRFSSIWEAVQKGHKMGPYFKKPDKVKEVYRCDCCGSEYESRSDLTYIEAEDIWVCRSCLTNNFYECPSCGQYHRFEDDTIEIHLSASPWDYELWCNECASNAESEGRIFWDDINENYYFTEDGDGNSLVVTVLNEVGATLRVSAYNVSNNLSEGRIFRHADGNLYTYRETN